MKIVKTEIHTDKVKQKFIDYKIKQESIPKFIVEQTTKFPIYSFDLSGYIDSNKILKEIENFPILQNNKPDLVIEGKQTDYLSKKDTNLFDDLIAAVEKRASSISHRNLYVKEFWIVSLDPSGMHRMHTHCPHATFCKFVLSGVYYPSSIDNRPLVFRNKDTELQIEVKENQLILFDTRLEHGVPKTLNSQTKRISVSFNFEF